MATEISEFLGAINMKKQVISVTIAISTVVLSAFPGLTNTHKKVGLGKVNRVRYQAAKPENSMVPMLNPEHGGVRPMPPPPPWIPPVEEGMKNTMPPSNTPSLRDSRNYTPMRNLPPSTPSITPTVENEAEIINMPPSYIQ